MKWQLLLIISVFSFAWTTILQRILLKNTKHDPLAYSAFFQVITGLLIAIYTMFAGFYMPNFISVLPNAILMIFLYSLTNICLFYALKYVEASVFTVLFLTRAIWSTLGAVLLLHESFSSQEGVGALLIFVGIVIISFKKKSITFNKGTILALLAGLFIGLGFVNDAFLVKSFDVPSYAVFAFVLPGIMTFFLSPKTILRTGPLLNFSIFSKIVLLAFFYAISYVTLFLAYKLGNNAGELGILNQTSTIVTVFLSIVFLKETTDVWKKVFGAIIAFIGVVLIG